MIPDVIIFVISIDLASEKGSNVWAWGRRGSEEIEGDRGPNRQQAVHFDCWRATNILGEHQGEFFHYLFPFPANRIHMKRVILGI